MKSVELFLKVRDLSNAVQNRCFILMYMYIVERQTMYMPTHGSCCVQINDAFRISFDHVHDTVQLVLNLKILHVCSEFFHNIRLRNEFSLSKSLFVSSSGMSNNTLK